MPRSNYVYIVYEAQEQGEPLLMSIHKQRQTANYACNHWNNKCNPQKEPGMNNYYFVREDLEE